MHQFTKIDKKYFLIEGDCLSLIVNEYHYENPDHNNTRKSLPGKRPAGDY
jgi:hypothetical protein